MRKVKSGSASPSPLVSPVYTTHDGLLAAPGDDGEKARQDPEQVRLSLRRVATDAREGIMTDSKAGFLAQEGRISVHVQELSRAGEVGKEMRSAGSEGQKAVPETIRRLASDVKNEMFHELQVHVETVD